MENTPMGMTKVAIAQRREQIQHLLSEREREGISLAALSRCCGIPHSTLAGWSTRLRRERLKAAGTASASAGPFVELVASPSSRGTSPDARFEVFLRGDRRVLVGSQFDEAALKSLVRTLEAC